MSDLDLGAIRERMLAAPGSSLDASVRPVVVRLCDRVAELEQENAQLRTNPTSESYDAMHDEQQSRIDRLRELLGEAYNTIQDHPPMNLLWATKRELLERMKAALERPNG